MAEDNLTGRARDYVTMQVAVGHVGWDDQEAYYEKGDPSGPPGHRHTLVYVTLGGKEAPVKAPDSRVRLLCAIGSGVFRIPKKGTMVYVIVPPGMEESPGAPLIIATREDDPPIQFEDDRIVFTFGDDAHIVIRGKSVSLSDFANRFLTVGTPRTGGTPGLTFQASDGSGGVIQEGVVSWFVAQTGDVKTLVQMTPSKYEVLYKSSPIASIIFKMAGNDFHIAGPGNGFVIPATLVLGAVGAGSPPYALAGTVGKVSGCVHISTDT